MPSPQQATRGASWVPSQERRELGTALRELLDVVVQTSASPSELSAATAAVRELAAKLTGLRWLSTCR